MIGDTVRPDVLLLKRWADCGGEDTLKLSDTLHPPHTHTAHAHTAAERAAAARRRGRVDTDSSGPRVPPKII